MKIDYDVGDVVVCVDASDCPELSRMGVYRVSYMEIVGDGWEDAGEVGTLLEGVRCPG